MNNSRHIMCILAAFSFLSFSQMTWAQEETFLGGEPTTVTTTVSEETEIPQESGAAQQIIDMTDGNSISRRRSPWSGSWFNWASVNMKDYSEGAGRLETYNYLSADYRLNWNSKISVRPEFYVHGAGRDFFGDEADSEVQMGDVYLQYSHNELALLGDVGLLGNFRVYYPNTENAKRQRQLTRLQARLIFQAPVGSGFWLAYHFRPTYLVQTRQSYMTEFFNTRANEHYRLEQKLELSKLFARRWVFQQDVGVEHRRYYGSSSNNIEPRWDSYLSMGTGIAVSLGSVRLKGGVSYESKIGLPERNRQVYNAEDSDYYLMTSVYF